MYGGGGVLCFQELLRSATGPTKTSREKVREKFVRKYVRQALRKLRIILTTPRGDAIVNNEVRQQKENRLFAETAIGIMRADDEKWDKLLDSVGMLASTPRGNNVRNSWARTTLHLQVPVATHFSFGQLGVP